MELQGNIGQIVADNTIELSTNHKLNYKTFGSFKWYQQKFETIIVLLRRLEAGNYFLMQ
jgi:hypothetical protein